MNVEPIKVLLVENDPNDVDLIQIALAQADFGRIDWDQVDSLGEAIESLGQTPFDLLLLDLSLPDAWGLDTVKQVRQQALDIPIVVLTGNADAELALEAVRLGAQDYLVKGKIESDLLVRTLKYAIERKQSEQMIRRRNLELALLNEERHRLSTALEQTAESIIITDAENMIVYVNPAFERVTGYSHSEVIGLSPDFLCSKKHDIERYHSLQRAIATGRVWQGRLTGKKKDN